MGLDMYMTATREMPCAAATMMVKSQGDGPSWQQLYSETANEWLQERHDPQEHVPLVANVAYWRKAYAIHSWFINNIDGSVDNCEKYLCDRELLEELMHDCKVVVDSDGQDLGVFRGANDAIQILDECRETIDYLSKILNDYEGWDIEYLAWW